MKRIAKIINGFMAIAMLLAFFYIKAAPEFPASSVQASYALILLVLFLSTLIYLAKGGPNFIRLLLIITNVIMGLAIYMPAILFLLSPQANIELWVPFYAVLVIIPFTANILALNRAKNRILNT